MMQRIIAVLMCCAALALGQSSTQAPDKAHYEILSAAGPGSLRLDRLTGKTARLSGGKWQDIAVPQLGAITTTEARFQLVVGPGNALPLLLDAQTGRTWQLAYNATANTYTWGLVPEPTSAP